MVATRPFAWEGGAPCARPAFSRRCALRSGSARPCRLAQGLYLPACVTGRIKIAIPTPSDSSESIRTIVLSIGESNPADSIMDSLVVEGRVGVPSEPEDPVGPTERRALARWARHDRELLAQREVLGDEVGA